MHFDEAMGGGSVGRSEVERAGCANELPLVLECALLARDDELAVALANPMHTGQNTPFFSLLDLRLVLAGQDLMLTVHRHGSLDRCRHRGKPRRVPREVAPDDLLVLVAARETHLAISGV